MKETCLRTFETSVDWAWGRLILFCWRKTMCCLLALGDYGPAFTFGFNTRCSEVFDIFLLFYISFLTGRSETAFGFLVAPSIKVALFTVPSCFRCVFICDNQTLMNTSEAMVLRDGSLRSPY